MYFMILDCETTNDIECPLVYDLGFSVIDENGKAYASYSFVNADIFCDNDLFYLFWSHHISKSITT